MRRPGLGPLWLEIKQGPTLLSLAQKGRESCVFQEHLMFQHISLSTSIVSEGNMTGWPICVQNVTLYMLHLGKMCSFLTIFKSLLVTNTCIYYVLCISMFQISANFVFSSQNPNWILTIESAPKNDRDHTIDSCVYEFHKNGVSKKLHNVC